MRARAVAPLLLALACGRGAEPPPLAAAAPPIPVSSVRVARETISEPVLGTGTLVADKATEIGPRVSGIVDAVQVDVGVQVAEGDPLFTTRQVDYRLRQQEAEQARRLASAEAENARTSGQGGLFGGEEHKVVAIKLPPAAHWSLADRMAQEREAFGFYFSAHPVDRYRHVASAHGARDYATLCAQPAPADGARTGAVIAVLIEDVRWRTSARGRRYAEHFPAERIEDVPAASLGLNPITAIPA